MRALFLAIIMVAGAWGSAQAESLCHFDINAKAWRNCHAVGAPRVKSPDQYLAIPDAPKKGAMPAEGCKLLKSAPGVDRWSCPPGTAQALREAMKK